MSKIQSDALGLVGRSIKRIRWNDDYLLFDTDRGQVGFEVWGGCCSTSYFYDFFGVEHLLRNGPVVSTRSIHLDDADSPSADSPNSEYTKCYGYEIVTVHPVWGEVTSVFSFRNDSNGYYGGSLGPCITIPEGKLIEVDRDQTGD